MSQPGVTAADYHDPHAFPLLRRWLSGDEKRIRSSFAVTDVLGEIDTGALKESLEGTCGAKARTLRVQLPPVTDRSSDQAYKNGMYTPVELLAEPDPPI